MDIFRIRGHRVLSGSVTVSGSKNATLPIMAATLLANEPAWLERVPRLGDVATMVRLLRSLGMRAAWQTDSLLRLETYDPRCIAAPWAIVRRMRASFCVLGPLLARRGEAIVPLPGGCRIGPRPVDLHLRGLAALGADLRVVDGNVIASARRLRGACIDLCGPHGPTVTGTANVMSAAVLARGKTTIQSAAREPEIVDLGCFLNRLGAEISGLGTSVIEIRGVEALGGGRHRVIPDRIEAGTLLAAGAMCRGTITVRDVLAEHLEIVLEALGEMGAGITATADRVTLVAPWRPNRVTLEARPYPGFATDLQSQLTAVAAIAHGRSRIGDGVFPTRFHHVAQLNRLGAMISRRRAVASIRGRAHLAGNVVCATDLRASAALVLAGLAAKGETIVRHIHHLDRGYERLDEKLSLLGARIERIAEIPALPSAVPATAPRDVATLGLVSKGQSGFGLPSRALELRRAASTNLVDSPASPSSSRPRSAAPRADEHLLRQSLEVA